MNKPPEGPIDVNGEYTPTTKQKITEIDADNWPNMNTTELWSQYTALQNRLSIVQSTYSDPVIIRHMQESLFRLNALILSKESETIPTQHKNSRGTGLI